MTLPITLSFAAAAALLNIWLATRIGELRLAGKVLHGDDGGGPLTRRMRAQLNYVENTLFVLILCGLIEAAGNDGLWLWGMAAAYLVARIAHAFGMELDRPNKARAAGVVTTMIVQLVLAVVAALIAARIL